MGKEREKTDLQTSQVSLDLLEVMCFDNVCLSVSVCAGSSLLCGLFSSYSQWGLIFAVAS